MHPGSFIQRRLFFGDRFGDDDDDDIDVFFICPYTRERIPVGNVQKFKLFGSSLIYFKSGRQEPSFFEENPLVSAH